MAAAPASRTAAAICCPDCCCSTPSRASGRRRRWPAFTGMSFKALPDAARHVHRHPQHLEAGRAAHRPGGWQRQVALLPQHRRQRRGGRRSEDGECPERRGDRAVHQPAAAAALPVRHRRRGRGARQGDLYAELRGVSPRVQRQRLPDGSDRHRSEPLASAECGRTGALPPALRRQRAGRLRNHRRQGREVEAARHRARRHAVRPQPSRAIRATSPTRSRACGRALPIFTTAQSRPSTTCWCRRPGRRRSCAAPCPTTRRMSVSTGIRLGWRRIARRIRPRRPSTRPGTVPHDSATIPT